MSDSSNICLSCGLCCDGTVIGFVQVDKDELPALREIKILEEDEGKGIFLQPCEKFCDACTIYDQRPKQCAIFKCGLLTSVENDKISFELALEAVEEVKQHKSDIEKQVEELQIELASRSFYFKTLELKKLLRKIKPHSAELEKYQKLIPILNQFDRVLLESFDLD